jgi:hypothetical protein
MPLTFPQSTTIYEYTSITLVGNNPTAGLDTVLNDYAANGWRLVTIADRTLVFERLAAAQEAQE